MATNRFEEIESKLAELGEVLNDPDLIGDPVNVLSHIKQLTREIDSLAQSLTTQDFDDYYTEEEGEEDGEEAIR